MKKVLCSTGALIGRPNNRDYRLIKEYAPKLNCDGFEFMMYSTWYNQVDKLIEELTKSKLHFPVMHCEKHIGEDVIFTDSFGMSVYPIKAVLPNEKVYYNFNNKYEGDQL